MNSFPVHPFGTQICARDVIEKMAGCRAWEDKYRAVIQWGKQLPPLPDALKQQSASIPGCESQVWLVWEKRSEKLHFGVDSDARIVKGLLCVILAAVEGKTAPEIKMLDFEAYFQQTGLIAHLSESRNNGLRAIIQHIKSID